MPPWGREVQASITRYISLPSTWFTPILWIKMVTNHRSNIAKFSLSLFSLQERYLICVLFSMVAISGGHSWSPFTSPSEYQPYQNRKIPYLKSSFQMGQPQVGLPQFISANQIPNRFSQPKPIIQSQSATRIPSGTSPYQTRPFFQSQQPGRLPDPAPIPRPISQSTIVPQSSITYPTLSGRNNGYHWGYSWIDQFGSQMFREETSDGMGTVWGRYSFRDYNVRTAKISFPKHSDISLGHNANHRVHCRCKWISNSNSKQRARYCHIESSWCKDNSFRRRE